MPFALSIYTIFKNTFTQIIDSCICFQRAMWSGKKCSEGGAGTPTEEEVKVVLVGDTQCGKTSLVQRFVSDTFVEVST